MSSVAHDMPTSPKAPNFIDDYTPRLVAIIDRPAEAVAGLAQEVAVDIAMDRGADEMRRLIGDCATGALVAGSLPVADAIKVSCELRADTSQQDRIASYGGLFVAPEAALLSLREVIRRG